MKKGKEFDIVGRTVKEEKIQREKSQQKKRKKQKKHTKK
jgi:hypothetical protein